jgi:hypothetical protein
MSALRDEDVGRLRAVPDSWHPKTHTDMYVMSVDLIQEFVDRAVLPIPESLKGFKPDPKGDAQEEEQMFVAEDVLGIGGEDDTP